MTNTYTWTTPRGAKIEATITATHITTRTVDADGFKVDTKCDQWIRTVDAMTKDGKPTALKELWCERGTECIMIGRIGKDRLLVALPANVVSAVYGEEREATKRKRDASYAAEKAYMDHYNMVRKAMDDD